MEFKNLKILRLEKGLSQKELCRELEKVNCCIDRSTYSKYESGDKKFLNDIIIKIALYYETSTDYIIGLTDDRTQPSKNKHAEDFLNKRISFK